MIQVFLQWFARTYLGFNALPSSVKGTKRPLQTENDEVVLANTPDEPWWYLLDDNYTPTQVYDFPAITGDAFKVRITDGIEVYWGDLPGAKPEETEETEESEEPEYRGRDIHWDEYCSLPENSGQACCKAFD